MTASLFPEHMRAAHSASDESDFSVTLHVTLPADYPDLPPQLAISGLEEELSRARIQQLMHAIEKTAEENLGMPMVFTLVSCLQVRQMIEARSS
jgi:hypothetical protein